VLETFTAKDGLPASSNSDAFADIAGLKPGQIVGVFPRAGPPGSRDDAETLFAVLSYDPNGKPSKRQLHKMLVTNPQRGGDPKDLNTRFGASETYVIPSPLGGQPGQKAIIRRNGYTEKFPAFLLDVESLKFDFIDDQLSGEMHQNAVAGNEMLVFFLPDTNKLLRVSAPGPKLEPIELNLPEKGGRMGWIGGSLVQVHPNGIFVADDLRAAFRKVGAGARIANWIKQSNHYGLVTISAGDEHNSGMASIDLKGD
jgi:hypothetical protein